MTDERTSPASMPGPHAPEPSNSVGVPAVTRATPADPDDVYDGQCHLDSLADTGCAYTAFQGWVLTCLWCPATARGRTKAEAVAGMQEHYDRVCGAGNVGVIR